MDDLKVAAVCMNAVPGEADKNLDRMEAFVQEAADRKADVICFPEFSVTGYVLKNPANTYNKQHSKQAMERLANMARHGNLIIISGIIEALKGPRPYASQVIVGPGGVIGHHRKTHLSPPEQALYRAGKEIQVFSVGHTKFGVQLCYEAHFPEISTLMALMGAHVIFAPHASPRGNPQEKLQSWMRHFPARSFDNSVFWVACNQVGKTSEGLSFPGVIVVLSPEGRILANYAGNKETILFVNLKGQDLQGIRGHRMKYFLPHRRPELYRGLLAHST